MEEFRLLVMCTANQCRSPMAEVIARAQLLEAGIDASVKSCGVLAGGHEAATGAVRAMKSRGLDISRHVSTRIDEELVQSADLILTMERRHLTEVAGFAIRALERAFVIRELVDLAPQVGHRSPGIEIGEWIAQANRFREPSTVLSFDTSVDLPDPMGGSQRGFNRSADEISRLLSVVWSYLFPAP